MDREQYVREANRQLEDQEFFKLLTKPVFMDSVEEIKQELDTLQKEGKSGIHNRTGYTKRVTILYFTQNSQKKSAWPFPNMPPDRPIVSDCGSRIHRLLSQPIIYQA